MLAAAECDGEYGFHSRRNSSEGRQQWWLPSASGHHCGYAVFLCIEPLAQKFLGFGHFSVPLTELLGIQKLSNALMNLAAMLFHLGNNVGLGCVGVRLHVGPDLFSPLGKSGL